MVRKKIFKENWLNPILLEYNEEKYEFEYLKDYHVFLLKDAITKKNLAIFSDEIGFIIEHEINGTTHFIVSDRSEYDFENEKGIYLKDYIELYQSLCLIKTYHVSSSDEKNLRIKDHYYKVETKKNGGCIYNLKEKSNFYQELYSEEEILKLFEEPIILVSRVLQSDYNPDIKDKITYGINLDTFCIATPIYSELQQRFIPVVTTQNSSFNRTISIPLEKREAMTIEKEIMNTIYDLEFYLEPIPGIYLKDNTLNQQFVRKFTKKS